MAAAATALLHQIHLLALHWNAERPALAYRRDPGAGEIERQTIGVREPLALHLSAERRCIGYYDFVQRQTFPCPFARHVQGRYHQCFHCQRQEVTFYTFTGQAADPAAAETYLQTRTHQAYLTLFGRDLLKVGVAAEGRQLGRTLEQGAVASRFFAQATGRAIRALETYIHRELHLKDRVTTLQNVRRLAALPTAAEAEALLRAAAERIAAALPPAFAGQLLTDQPFHFHQPKYRLQLPPAAGEAQLIQRVGGGETYAGIVRGVVGSLLILEATDGHVYVLPVKPLQGYLLRVEHEADLQLTHPPRAIRFEE